MACCKQRIDKSILPFRASRSFFSGVNLTLSAEMITCVSFVLYGDDVSEVAIEAVGSDMCTALCVDKLAGSADPVARLPHAAFQYIAHAEVATDLLHVDRLTLVSKARVARDHMEFGKLREIGDDVLADNRFYSCAKARTSARARSL
jgi:hypothetical protein